MSIGHGELGPSNGTRSPNQSSMNYSDNQFSVSMTDDTMTSRRQNRLKALYLDGNLLETIPAEISEHE